MKMVKSLLLGTAAGLVAMSGAQAADLPVKAKPVQYVKICSLYGAGFYYIPGTDTCIKVGGYVRAEMNFSANGSFNPYRSQNFDAPSRNYQVVRTRGGVTLDTRSQTEYGTLRSYVNLFATSTNSGSVNSAGQIFSNGSGGVGGNAYSALYSTAAFIQFAGFTIGSTESFFTFDSIPYSNDTSIWGGAQGGSGIWVGGYTAQLGNGLSASIAAEDSTARQSSILDGTYNAAALVPAAPGGITAVNNGYGGRRWPDFVANLRVDQAWGSAQIMGAIHDVYANNGVVAGANSTFSTTGYALGAGAKLNLPMLGKSDYIQGQVTWARGATNYNLQNTGFGAVNSFALTNGSPVASNTALGPVFDAVVTGGGTGLDLSTTWSITGGYEHYWVPTLKTSLYGGYGRTRYSDAASAAIIAGGAGLGGGFVPTGSISANWSAWQIGSRTVWTPVTNLDLSVDLLYSKVNTAFGGSSTAGFGTFSDKGFLAGMFRAQRNFYP